MDKKRLSSLLLAGLMVFGFAGSSLAAGEKVSLEAAVKNGIEKSRALDQVELEIDLAGVSKSRGSYASRKLRRGKKDLSTGAENLGKAESAWDAGFLPDDIVLPDGTIIPQGTPAQNLPDEVKQGVEKSLEDARKALDRGDSAILSALDKAGATIGGNLDFASLQALDIDSSADMLELMPSVAFEVTQASFDIYKNSIALLIQKSYYDVLQAQELVKAKKAALDRAAKQHEFVKAAYDEGMKAKDDLLVSEVYYKSTKIALDKAQGDLDSALVTLKKNASLDMGKDIVLEDVMVRQPEDFNLQAGLESGMKNRLEMKKALGEVVIYTSNFDETKGSYTPNTFQYKEAEILKDKAGVRYGLAREEVESSIRQSYALVLSTADMLAGTQGLVESARENLEIAKLKYEEGFGVDNILLGTLNISDSAGTIIEVLAAQEKLTEVEESVVKITYAYNLARMKYKNDIGDFVY